MEKKSDNVLFRRLAITTVILLTSLLVPVVAVPYALTHKRISRLPQQIDHLIVINADLWNLVSKSAYDITLRRAESARAASIVEKESKSEISLLRRDILETQAQLNSLRSATGTELQTLLDEGKLMRQAMLASLPHRRLDLLPLLGLSLVDVAASMHAVELHQGVPSSTVHNDGIERLRALALKLQISSTPHKSSYLPAIGSMYSAATSLFGLPRILRPAEVNIAAVYFVDPLSAQRGCSETRY